MPRFGSTLIPSHSLLGTFVGCLMGLDEGRVTDPGLGLTYARCRETNLWVLASSHEALAV